MEAGKPKLNSRLIFIFSLWMTAGLLSTAIAGPKVTVRNNTVASSQAVQIQKAGSAGAVNCAGVPVWTSTGMPLYTAGTLVIYSPNNTEYQALLTTYGLDVYSPANAPSVWQAIGVCGSVAATNTPTKTFTPVFTATFTPTVINTATLTSTNTSLVKNTFTPTNTPTIQLTATFTPSFTFTSQNTATFTFSNTPTVKSTSTFTPTLTATQGNTLNCNGVPVWSSMGMPLYQAGTLVVYSPNNTEYKALVTTYGLDAYSPASSPTVWQAIGLCGSVIGTTATFTPTRTITPTPTVTGPCLTFPAAYSIPNVPLIAQEVSEWCWAACGEMVMKYWGHDVAQCSEASAANNRTDCCSYGLCPNQDEASPCNNPGWPNYAGYGFSSQSTGTPLTFAQLQQQFYCQQSPTNFQWVWPGGGSSHLLVAMGYQVDSTGTQWIEIHDPLPECQGTDRFITYDDYIDVDDPTYGSHTHGTDIYDITIAGGHS